LKRKASFPVPLISVAVLHKRTEESDVSQGTSFKNTLRGLGKC